MYECADKSKASHEIWPSFDVGVFLSVWIPMSIAYTLEGQLKYVSCEFLTSSSFFHAPRDMINLTVPSGSRFTPFDASLLVVFFSGSDTDP